MSEHFQVKEAVSAEELDKIIALRYEILRAPWEQPYESSRDELEERSVNAYIEDGAGNVIACGRLQEVDRKTGQVRYMAVADEWQGKGLGALILQHLENRGAALGFEVILLQARENAVGFYSAHGYAVKDKTFLLWGKIQHFLMTKTLRPG